MPLSYLFPFDRAGALGGHFAFRKRVRSWPDFTSIGMSLAAWKLRLSEYAEHLLHDLLALLVAGGAGESGQEGMERILCLGEAEPSRIQAKRRAGLIHRGAR